MDSEIDKSDNKKEIYNNQLELNNIKTYTIEDAVDHAGLGLYQLKLMGMVGMLSAADAMEMLLLSVLGPSLQCVWHLSSGEKALLTTVVFIGFLIGSFFWGMVSDNFGRKATFLVVTSLITYVGLLTAFSPTYIWVILLRCIVGFGIGGTASSFTLLSEFLPSKYRAKSLILYQIWWAFGSTFEIGLAFVILPKYGWRWLVGLSAVPLSVCLCLIIFIPESPRFLLNRGKLNKSQNIVNSILKTNKKPSLEGKLINKTGSNGKFKLKYLFLDEYLCTTLLLLILWFGVTFSYYGIILLNAEFFTFHHKCYGDSITDMLPHNRSVTYVDTSCCQGLDNDDYKSMLISSFGEFFVIPLNFFLADLIGRVKTIALEFALTTILFATLNACMSQMMSTIVMFGIRGFSSGMFNLIYIYTSEVYPTSMRSTATGLCSSFARGAAILTPFVAQVLIPKTSLLYGLLVYTLVALVCSIAAFCLPIETRGRPLPQNFKEMEIEMTEK